MNSLVDRLNAEIEVRARERSENILLISSIIDFDKSRPKCWSNRMLDSNIGNAAVPLFLSSLAKFRTGRSRDYSFRDVNNLPLHRQNLV